MPSAPLEQATIANWREPPFNRWAFHHIPELIPTAKVAAGAATRDLPVAARTLDGFRVTGPRGDVFDLPGFLEATFTDALVILRDGRIVFEHYDAGMDAATPHILMSCTKSITGLIAAMLAARGDIDLEALASRYVPEIAATAFRGVTLRQLLDMRAGVALDAAQQAAYAATNWEVKTINDARAMRPYLVSLDKADPHGGPFRYVSANTDLIGWAIERATGADMAALTSALLWAPMGAAHDAFFTTDREGAAWTSGGFCATARDLARLGQLFIEDGAGVIAPAIIEDIATGGDLEAWRQGQFAPAFADRDMTYRNGWYTLNRTPQIPFAMGVYGQNLFIDRARRIVIAKFSSQPERFDYALSLLTHSALAPLIDALA